MYFVNDIHPILKVMEDSRPKADRAIIDDVYPECNLDLSGEPVAPYDGYMVGTSTAYDKGATLPYQPVMEALRANKQATWRLEIMCDNVKHTLTGSNKQLALAVSAARKQYRKLT